jgi:HK97 family phage portal protein
MSLLDAVRSFLTLEPMQPDRTLQIAWPDIQTQINTVRRDTQALRIHRVPSVAEALGVPAIQRCVTLIANTVGSLTMQGYRNGALMTDTPRLIARPDPDLTPRDFYAQTAHNMASFGEAVLYIASRDADGIASALVNVPLGELAVEENTRDRRYPIYQWGKVQGTRFTAANPTGSFVHVMYLPEPFALRGRGPLQRAGAAISVAVEAQQWAANYYADGGNGGTIIKKQGYLSSDSDEALSEADALRNQWVGRPNNVPRIIDEGIESVTSVEVNPQGAQMLDARGYQNGDAARLFGIPGALLEYAQSGTSLTYQNIEQIWTNFLRGCLDPNYLEPIEQAISDLLPRSTASRFDRSGLLRADIKTRSDVYNTLIPLGVLTMEEARAAEGLSPGNAEYAAVLPSPPAAVAPAGSIPVALSATRCPRCNRMLGKFGPTFEVVCPRCKFLNVGAAAPTETAPGPVVPIFNVNVHFPEGFVRTETTVTAPNVTIEPGAVEVTVDAPITLAQPAPTERTVTDVEYDDHDRIMRVIEGAA